MKALKIQNLKKSYKKLEVLKWINLTIERWDFFWLLWKNWAWKTTTINILTDLVIKTSWEVKVFWTSIDKSFSEAKSMIWVVPQEFNFDIFSKLIDIVVYQAWFYWISKSVAKERSEELFKKLWLWDKRNEMAKDLSGWMKRRLMIVRALIHKPKLLILDEPTAWVDVEHRKDMWEFLVDLNKSWTTILLTTHYLEEAEMLCNNIAIMSNWKIIKEWSPRELLKWLNEEDIVLYLKWWLKEIPDTLVKSIS